MKPQPRVSVVVPTYNRATLLPLTLDSALAQHYRDFEIVVVDDGSTDDTPHVLARYDSRVRSFWQPNRGVNAARNRAIVESRGEYIALLDSDDLWQPYALELMVGLLDRIPSSGFVFTDFHILRDSGAPRPHGWHTWHGHEAEWQGAFSQVHDFAALGVAAPAGLPPDRFSVYVGDIYTAALRGAWVPTSSSLFRRSAAGPLTFPEDDASYGDSEFFARLSRRHGAVYADVETMLNRSHDDEVRLTRIDATVQLRRRLRMIERVWGADADFLARHRTYYETTRTGLLLKAARLHLLRSERRQAREYLAQAAAAAPAIRRFERLSLQVAAMTPGSGAAMRALRSALHRMRGPDISRASPNDGS